MSKEESTASPVRLREGYQPTNAEVRGHQVALDKGYQPKTQIAVPQPPHVGSAAVIPSPTSAPNQQAQVATKTKE
jgi:hypothetical protein